MEADLDKLAAIYNTRMAKENPPIVMNNDGSLLHVPPNTQFQGEQLCTSVGMQGTVVSPEAVALPPVGFTECAWTRKPNNTVVQVSPSAPVHTSCGHPPIALPLLLLLLLLQVPTVDRQGRRVTLARPNASDLDWILVCATTSCNLCSQPAGARKESWLAGGGLGRRRPA